MLKKHKWQFFRSQDHIINILHLLKICDLMNYFCLLQLYNSNLINHYNFIKYPEYNIFLHQLLKRNCSYGNLAFSSILYMAGCNMLPLLYGFIRFCWNSYSPKWQQNPTVTTLKYFLGSRRFGNVLKAFSTLEIFLLKGLTHLKGKKLPLTARISSVYF